MFQSTDQTLENLIACKKRFCHLENYRSLYIARDKINHLSNCKNVLVPKLILEERPTVKTVAALCPLPSIRQVIFIQFK